MWGKYWARSLNIKLSTLQTSFVQLFRQVKRDSGFRFVLLVSKCHFFTMALNCCCTLRESHHELYICTVSQTAPNPSLTLKSCWDLFKGRTVQVTWSGVFSTFFVVKSARKTTHAKNVHLRNMWFMKAWLLLYLGFYICLKISCKWSALFRN